jgi:imidazolonepropionase-like amidohydrolase
MGFDATKAARDMERSVWVGKELRKRGIRVIIGGDYGLAWQPHGTNAEDIEHLINYCGYTAIEALTAATRIGGEAMRLSNELGQLQPGYLADLILVRGDPLKDVRLLQDRDNLALIMSDGELYKKPDPSVHRRQVAA